MYVKVTGLLVGRTQVRSEARLHMEERLLVEECESIEFVGVDSNNQMEAQNVDGTTEQASGISSLPSGQGSRFDGKRNNVGARWTHGT